MLVGSHRSPLTQVLTGVYGLGTYEFRASVGTPLVPVFYNRKVYTPKSKDVYDTKID